MASQEARAVIQSSSYQGRNFESNSAVSKAMALRHVLLCPTLTVCAISGCQGPAPSDSNGGAISKEGLDFVAHTLSETAKRAQKLTPQEQGRLAKSSNAIDQYELGARIIDDPKHVLNKAYDSGGFPPQISSEGAKVIKSNARSVELAAVGLTHKLDVAPPANSKSPESYWSVADMFPHKAEAKQLAKFVCLSGDLAGSEGNKAAAVQDYALAFNIGAQFLDQGSTLIDYLVGIAIEAIARRHYESIAPFLNSRDLRTAAETLLQRNSHPRSISDQVQTEILTSPSVLPNDEELKKMTAEEKREMAEVPALKKELAEMMLKRKSVFSGPFAARGPVPRPGPSTRKNPMADVIFLMVPLYDEFWLDSLNSQTNSRLLGLKLAAMAYQIDHHRLPTTLSELFDGNSKLIPEDPFYPGRLMLASANKDTFSIYSRGPDGKDDGGRSIQYKSKLVRPLADSKGDVVVILRSGRPAFGPRGD